MNMIPSLLFTSLVALALGGPAARAETAAQAESEPAGSGSSAADSTASGAATADAPDPLYEALQQRYQLLGQQMQQIREARDPAERRSLLLEHWQTLHRDVGPGGGDGTGPGMMRGYVMRPAPAGGYAIHGYGVAPGMMAGPQIPGLSAEQQARIASIRDETRKKNWQLMGAIMDEQSRLRELSETPQPDSAAIGEAGAKIGSLQRQMYDNAVEAHRRMGAVLTPEQVEGLQRWRQGG